MLTTSYIYIPTYIDRYRINIPLQSTDFVAVSCPALIGALPAGKNGESAAERSSSNWRRDGMPGARIQICVILAYPMGRTENTKADDGYTAIGQIGGLSSQQCHRRLRFQAGEQNVLAIFNAMDAMQHVIA
jgi:hypothetical protein